MSIIAIEKLSFAYEKQSVLENISLRVEKKDFLAIIGPNGGGKSTLLKLILGINTHKEGEISIFGTSPKNALDKLGYVPQNTNINIDFPIKVLEVVMMGHIEGKRRFFGYGNSEKRCAMAVLRQVGMEDFAETKIASLSGGQRQRVMIARALCASPQILLLDEPTSSIDIAGQRDIYELLKVLNQSISIVVVSHDISVILEYANKVAHINKHLSYHDISDKKSTFHTHKKEEHFCEIELLQMLGSSDCHTCDEVKT
jgi:zinc transport system ATP-binding protein